MNTAHSIPSGGREPAIEEFAPDATLHLGYVATAPLIEAIARVVRDAPFRHLRTPGGGTMSVAMTNCGMWGWHSDAGGYRYLDADPQTGRRWPALPEGWADLAARAAADSGYADFAPDCCLINRYEVGARMGAHRDCDERDMRQPIVSVSIGLPAVFLWYGRRRAGSPLRIPVSDGDVVVFGGSARAAYHGVRKLDAGHDPRIGALRYNLTFRRAR
jgi:alkylated DNA repair protein (DNA oxidative demethylase)